MAFPGPWLKNKAGTRQSMTVMEPLFKEVETPPDKSGPGAWNEGWVSTPYPIPHLSPLA